MCILEVVILVEEETPSRKLLWGVQLLHVFIILCCFLLPWEMVTLKTRSGMRRIVKMVLSSFLKFFPFSCLTLTITHLLCARFCAKCWPYRNEYAFSCVLLHHVLWLSWSLCQSAKYLIKLSHINNSKYNVKWKSAELWCESRLCIKW